MGCSSNYMAPNAREIELSKVVSFLEELKTGTLNREHLDGNHPDVHNNASQERLNEATAELCGKLSSGTVDVTTNSLELQIWWRDHLEGEERRAKEDAAAEAATLNASIERITNWVYGNSENFANGSIGRDQIREHLKTELKGFE